ncbi:nnp-1 protein putative nuclear protein 1 nop52 [Anaeramoeba flamelloides]|uniref:Nnp-1 protein putative nuclear protein 1 nop52 n=1 Tax=Anaeramoeba flamelloides TaxID=1746091 RepID=A0ABQ8ZDL2_9EUKA|nr:nnp-1 protein putative nuclear protein 1 nop52 [Anaeramoeba flamelloides]
MKLLFILIFLFLPLYESSCPFVVNGSTPDSGTAITSDQDFSLIVSFSENVLLIDNMDLLDLSTISSVELQNWFFDNFRQEEYHNLAPIHLVRQETDSIINPTQVNLVITTEQQGNQINVIFQGSSITPSSTFIIYVLDDLFQSTEEPCEFKLTSQSNLYYYTSGASGELCLNYVANPKYSYCPNDIQPYIPKKENSSYSRNCEFDFASDLIIEPCTINNNSNVENCSYVIKGDLKIVNSGNSERINFDYLAVKNSTDGFLYYLKDSDEYKLEIEKHNPIVSIEILEYNQTIYNAEEFTTAKYDFILLENNGYIERSSSEEFLDWLNSLKNDPEVTVASNPQIYGNETIETIEAYEDVYAEFYDTRISTTENAIIFTWEKDIQIWKKESLESRGFDCDQCSTRSFDTFYAQKINHKLKLDKENPLRVLFISNDISEFEIDNKLSIKIFECNNKNNNNNNNKYNNKYNNNNNNGKKIKNIQENECKEIDNLKIINESNDEEIISENNKFKIILKNNYQVNDLFDNTFNLQILIPFLNDTNSLEGPNDPIFDPRNVVSFSNFYTCVTEDLNENNFGITYKAFYEQTNRCDEQFGENVGIQLEEFKKTRLGIFDISYFERLNGTFEDQNYERIRIDDAIKNLILEYSHAETQLEIIFNSNLISFHEPYLYLNENSWKENDNGNGNSQEELDEKICNNKTIISFDVNTLMYHENEFYLTVQLINNEKFPVNYTYNIQCDFTENEIVYDSNNNYFLIDSESNLIFNHFLRISNSSDIVNNEKMLGNCSINLEIQGKEFWSNLGKNYTCLIQKEIYYGKFLEPCQLIREEPYLNTNSPLLPNKILYSDGLLNISFLLNENQKTHGFLLFDVQNIGKRSSEYKFTAQCIGNTSISFNPQNEINNIEGNFETSLQIETYFNDFSNTDEVYLDDYNYIFNCSVLIEIIKLADECWSNEKKQIKENFIFIVQNGQYYNDIFFNSQYNEDDDDSADNDNDNSNSKSSNSQSSILDTFIKVIIAIIFGISFFTLIVVLVKLNKFLKKNYRYKKKMKYLKRKKMKNKKLLSNKILFGNSSQDEENSLPYIKSGDSIISILNGYNNANISSVNDDDDDYDDYDDDSGGGELDIEKDKKNNQIILNESNELIHKINLSKTDKNENTLFLDDFYILDFDSDYSSLKNQALYPDLNIYGKIDYLPNSKKTTLNNGVNDLFGKRYQLRSIDSIYYKIKSEKEIDVYLIRRENSIKMRYLTGKPHKCYRKKWEKVLNNISLGKYNKKYEKMHETGEIYETPFLDSEDIQEEIDYTINRYSELMKNRDIFDKNVDINVTDTDKDNQIKLDIDDLNDEKKLKQIEKDFDEIIKKN